MRRFSKQQLGGQAAAGEAGVPAIVVDDSSSSNSNNNSLSKQSSNSNSNTNSNDNSSSNFNNKRKRLVQYGRRAVRFPISLSPSPPPPQPPPPSSSSTSSLPPPPPAAAVANPQRPISISSSSSSTTSLIHRPSSSSYSERRGSSVAPAADRPHNNNNNNNNKMSWFPSSENIEYNQKPPKLPPKKPSSQMAASRPEEPDEEKIANFLGFSGETSREVAIRYLKAKHNDIQAAAVAYLDGEDISKDEAASQWDESAFSMDREGNADQFLQPLGAPSATATRPNSPAPSMMNHSSSSRQNMQPSTRAEEGEDFAKALEMSRDSAGGGGGGVGVAAAGQEMGMIAADGRESRIIGPATQKEYDERNNWQMVPYNQQQQQQQSGRNSSDEVVPDLDAPDRVNQPGQPRLLKHLPDGDYLSAFLTICHSIDGVRDALLMRDHLQTSYGEDAEWWRGHPISMPTIVHIDDGSPAEPDRSQADDLIAEVQRLMAFLNSSERSYASVGALTQTQAIRDSSPVTTQSKTLLELFIRCWISAASSKVDGQNPSRLRNLFTTTVGTNSPDGMDTPDMNVVDLQVCISEGSTSNLMERLDDLLWDTDADGEVTTDNFVERPAEVVVVRLFQQSAADKQLRVEVPASFHIDKYLPQNLDATRGTRRSMALAKKRIATIEEIETRLRLWKHPTKDKQLDAKLLLSHTLGHFSGQNRAQVLSADKSFSASAEGEEDFQDPPHYADISQRLQSIIASIDSKLAILASEKEKTRKALVDLSRSPGSGLPESELKYRYTLRGVATKPNITYLLAPVDPPAAAAAAAAAAANDEVLNAGTDDTNKPMTNPTVDDDSPSGLQWWRLEYEVPSTVTSAKITKTPAADYDVLRAVELEHNAALLVYASDRIQTALGDGDDDDSAMVVDPLIASAKSPPATTINTSMDTNTTSSSHSTPTTTTLSGANNNSSNNTPLPLPLQDFIARDNALFHLELSSDPSQPPAYNETEEDSSLESNIAVAANRNPTLSTLSSTSNVAAIGGRSRAASVDSTRANMGDDSAPDSPRVLDVGEDVEMFGSGPSGGGVVGIGVSGGVGGGYGSGGGYGEHSGQENPGFGLGPDLGAGGGHFASSGGGGSRRRGAEDHDDDGPVHEIRLEDLDEGAGGAGGGMK